MTVAFINPGSGPVDGATEELACLAMEQLVKDTGSERFERCPRHDSDGRYGFKIYRRNKHENLNAIDVEMPSLSPDLHAVDVEMPGLPLDQVRYLGPPQNILNFPRLYVDGSSWVWCFAVSAVLRSGESE